MRLLAEKSAVSKCRTECHSPVNAYINETRDVCNNQLKSFSKFAGKGYLFLFAFIIADADNVGYFPNPHVRSFNLKECILALLRPISV